MVGYTPDISTSFRLAVRRDDSEYVLWLTGRLGVSGASSAFSHGDSDADIGLLSSSLGTNAEEPTSCSVLIPANFLAIVAFLAAALARAACTRTARLASVPTPPDMPVSNGTKATAPGLKLR